MIAHFTNYAMIVAAATAPAEDRSAYYAAELELNTTAMAARASSDMVAEERAEFERGLLDLLGRHHVEMADEDPNAAELTVELAWANAKRTVYAVEIRCQRPDGGTHSKSYEIIGDHYDVLARIENDLPTILGWLERPLPGDVPATPPPPVATCGCRASTVA